MIDLGLAFLDLHIQQTVGGFRYSVHFQLEQTGRMYSELGTAATPLQCTEAAMSYIAMVVRDAVAA